MQPDITTPLADVGTDLDVELEHAGTRWTLVGFGDGTILVSEVGGRRNLVLDRDQQANAEVVTLGDAIDTAVEEAVSPVDLWMLSILLLRNVILMTARASVGPIQFADGSGAYACLVGPVGLSVESMAWAGKELRLEGPAGGRADAYAPDTSAFAAARVFLDRATRRGVRLALGRVAALDAAFTVSAIQHFAAARAASAAPA